MNCRLTRKAANMEDNGMVSLAWFIFEAGVALALLLGIVWWTMRK